MRRLVPAAVLAIALLLLAAANLASNFSTPTLEAFLQIADRLHPGSLES